MTKRIFRSICAVAITVFLASLVLIMCVLYNHFSGEQMTELRLQTNLAAQGVAISGTAYFDGLETSKYRFTWIDADGSVKYDTDASAAEMENHMELEEIQEALQTGYGESSRYSDTLMERRLYAAKRLVDGTVIRVSDSQQSVFILIVNMLPSIAAITAVVIIVSMILASQLSKKIVNPLNELDLDDPTKNTVYEELSPLLKRIDEQQRKLKLQTVELEKAGKMRREFTANVSHELKTPLHAISGYAELLSNGMVKTEDVPKFSGQIYSESKRMIALIEDIIGLSHLDEGAYDMQREDLDLYALAQDTISNLIPIANRVGVKLALVGGPAPVHGIPQLLSGIIRNLCDNAIKYNKPNGTVKITVKDSEDGAVLMVADSGIGISQEDQDRIFERFYRVDKSRSKAVGGTGLGLSIVKHAANLHNAKIRVHSVLNRGTTVIITFPKIG